MGPYTFNDALTGSSISCDYPGLQALMVEQSGEAGGCDSLFFPGCSLINYGLPLVQSVYDLLKSAGEVEGISLLCCGKILQYEPDGPAQRRAFEAELIEQVEARGVRRIVAACPNCALALRGALVRDERTQGVEIVALPLRLAQMGYRIDADVARELLTREFAWRHPDWYDEAGNPTEACKAPEPLLFMPHDSCPDKKTGEFADGLRALMPEGLLVEGEKVRKRSVCCGSLARAAGKTELADSQAREHGQDACGLGASAIVTACVSCTFQLMMAQRDVPVFHYLELLFNWRIDWYHADVYMKLRFLFDDSLGVEKQDASARSFVGLGGEGAAKEDA